MIQHCSSTVHHETTAASPTNLRAGVYGDEASYSSNGNYNQASRR